MNLKRILLAAAVVLAVLGVVAVRELRNTTTAVTAEAAVERFEDEASAAVESTTVPATESTTTVPQADEAAPQLPLPAPGVYELTATGSESIDLLTGGSHVYPEQAFLTVTPTACGVELRWDLIVERWQTLELCDSPDGPELVGEQIFHSFFGQEDLVVRQCDDSLLAVGTAAWSCLGETSIAERAVDISTGTRQLADGTDAEVLIVTSELLEGDHPDNVETIEQWWDLTTGLPVFETRTYDFTLDTPLGNAAYVEDYAVTLTSSDPVS